MYIGRATSQKSPLGIPHPDRSAALESITIQSLDLILDLPRPPQGVSPLRLYLFSEALLSVIQPSRPDAENSQHEGNCDNDPKLPARQIVHVNFFTSRPWPTA